MSSVSNRVRRIVRRVVGPGPPSTAPTIPAALLDLERAGAVPLVPPPARTERALRIAAVIPSFRRGSGGHGTIVHLLNGLADRGHAVSLWLEDFEHRHADATPDAVAASFCAFFGADHLEFHTGFDDWRGADIVVATGWQTVPRVLLLPHAGARAYLVQDHEPEFYATSSEAMLAAATYRYGLHCIAASGWLAELLRDRYGVSASHFDLAVDHTIYRPAATPRPRNVILFYARASTPRRAVPLGLAALQELVRRRPDVDVALFGADSPPFAPFPHRNLGVLDPPALAHLYQCATIGMVFSLTNPSLVALEMMAAGLPCVEVATEPVKATFGASGAPRLAEPSPLAICSTLETLLDDETGRTALGEAGAKIMQERTWDTAAEQLEHALRLTLASTAESRAWPAS